MTSASQFTVSITTGPERWCDLAKLESSLFKLKDDCPEDIIIFCNPYTIEDHKDLTRHSPKLELFCFKRFVNLSKTWNLSIIHSRTPYVILCNDDLIFHDKEVFDKLLAKHQEGYKIVHATENWSATSIHKSLICETGWFDENFPHSWEDVDFRYRMTRLGIKDFRFEPHLITHTRSKKGLRQDYKDYGGKYFFDKWNIEEFTGKTFNNPEERMALHSTGFFRNANPFQFSPKETPDFYPVDKNRIAKEYPWKH